MSESAEQPKMTWEMLQARVEVFSEKLNSALEELGILKQCKDLKIDHICVRLKNGADVNDLKIQLSETGQIISSVNVNGREISMIQLNEALNLGSWQTYGVELPYPKPNHNYADGWEHVEFVLNGADNTMDGVRQAFMDTFNNLDRNQLESDYAYSEDEPHADGDQIPNPTVGLKVNGVGLKFHANPIQVIVGFEE
jgi:predicted metalloenzyme YecM